MSSANPHTAKNIFSDTKRRLSERVSMNIHNTASVAREIIRGKNMNIYRQFRIQKYQLSFVLKGSKSNDIILTSAKGLASSEASYENSMKSLKKISAIQSQNANHLLLVQEAAESLPNLKEQVGAMER